MPKYSIIIPCYNGMPYIKSCIETITSQDFNDYELIITEDHSTDGTAEFIDSLHHKNIHIHHCPSKTSMAEHWEWALSFAKGEWLIFVGQDDGLQSYFFKLAEKLTAIADKKNIRSIMSERAYYNWLEQNEDDNQMVLYYQAKAGYKIKNSKTEVMKALLNMNYAYFFLPEMYTTSIVKRTVIEEAKNRQNGKLFTTHPQDANLGAIICGIEKKFLYSNIPLGWVGTSPKSAGRAIAYSNTVKSTSNIEELKSTYLDKIQKSNLKIDNRTGSFMLASLEAYFWNAILCSQHFYSKKFIKSITSKKFMVKLFSNIYTEIQSSTLSNKNERFEYLKQTLEVNGLTLKDLTFIKQKTIKENKSKLYSLSKKIIYHFFKTKEYSILITKKNAINNFQFYSESIADKIYFI